MRRRLRLRFKVKNNKIENKLKNFINFILLGLVPLFQLQFDK